MQSQDIQTYWTRRGAGATVYELTLLTSNAEAARSLPVAYAEIKTSLAIPDNCEVIEHPIDRDRVRQAISSAFVHIAKN